jgi:hypothetical protein
VIAMREHDRCREIAARAYDAGELKVAAGFANNAQHESQNWRSCLAALGLDGKGMGPNRQRKAAATIGRGTGKWADV